MQEYQSFTLTRTGDRPLQFTGEIIAEAGGRLHAGQEQNRWHEIRVYRTVGGKYVLAVEYCTCWQGEDGHHHSSVHDTTADVAEEIKYHDPLVHLLGYPPHPQFAEKQARLEDSLRQRWGVLLSDILGKIPGAAEKIE